MKKIKCRTLTLLLFLSSLSLSAQVAENIQLHLRISELENAQAPFIYEDTVILSYYSRRPVRFVGATFGHEDFSRIHPYRINGHDVFFLAIPIADLPEELDVLEYRIQVDGIWMDDPRNPGYEYDLSGERISRVAIARQIESEIESPEVENGIVQFRYRSTEGENVYIAGSFNNWDPFMHRLKPEGYDRAGVYSIKLRLLPGIYYYYYRVNGEQITDPLNDNVAYNFDSKPVSYFRVP